MILVADPHMNPGEMTPMFRAALDLSYSLGEPMCSDGDTYQFLPHGTKRWEGSPCIAETKRYVTERDMLLVLMIGNHDPPGALEYFFADCPNVLIERTLEIPYRVGPQHPEEKVVIRHGHSWCPQWSWLAPIAPPVVDYLAETFPGMWFSFSDRMGWIPSRVISEKEYHIVVRSVFSGGLRYISENQCRLVLGHTHKWATVYEQFPGGLVDGVLYSLAPLDTGCYLRVQYDKPITWGTLLPGGRYL